MLYPIISPFPDGKIAPSDKVTPNEEVEKQTIKLDDIKEAVFMICRKNLDNFQDQSTGSTDWFNIDCEWLKEMYYTLEPDFYFYKKKNIEGEDIEPYKIFVVSFDNTKFKEKIYLPMPNDSVTPNKRKNIEGLFGG